MRIGNFSIEEEPLRLGNLQGNRFRLVIRNCSGTPAQIESVRAAW